MVSPDRLLPDASLDAPARAATPAPGREPAHAGEPDAERLVRGAGTYVADLLPAGCAHAAFARSAVARARRLRVDATLARAMPGVLAVFTGADTAALGRLVVNPVVEGIRAPSRPLLALDEVCAVGEPVALVVALTPHAAREAAEAIAIDGDPLDPVVDVDAALEAAPLLPGWPDNLMLDRAWRTDGVAAAFADAAQVVEVELDFPRVAPVPMEPRAVLARPDGDLLRVWLATQTPHRARTDLARILGRDPATVHAIAPDVGGAFGGKASMYPEDALVAHAAVVLGRPVRWVASRLEDFTSASHGRGGRIRARLALDADGRARALSADLRFPVGAWGTFSAAVPGWNAARILPGPYRIDEVDVRVRELVVNTAAVGIYRGAGRPEAAVVMERLMDAAAARLRIDPVELRRRNLLAAAMLPRTLASGAVLDSADPAALLERAVRLADYPALREAQRRRRAAGEVVGIGVAMYVEPCGQGWESARVRRDAHGGFTVESGSSSQGQGHRALFARIAAEALGVAPGRVTVIEGDTARTPAGIGALASRGTAIGGSAVALAARQLRERLQALPAGDGVEQVAEAVYHAPREAWSSGCAIALLSIDRDTGSPCVERFAWVDDAGRVFDERSVHAQLVGGLVQGLGSVLGESLHHDADGQLLTGSLMDYALPRIGDLPLELRLESAPTATDANLLGARGVGESGCIAAPPAILNAAIDALAPFGVRSVAPCLTAERLWRAMRPSETERDSTR
jgi:carbon-monoxide dehydrogenase large subunit